MYFAATIGDDAYRYRDGFGFLLFNDPDCKKNLEAAKQTGFEGVELFMTRPFDFDYDGFFAYARKLGIRVSNFGTIVLSCKYGVSLVNDDAEKSKAASGMLQELVRQAGAHGASVAVGGYRGAKKGRGKEEYFETLYKAMAPSIKIAEDTGSHISIEAISREIIDWGFTCTDITEFMDYCASPAVKIHYDTIHAHYNERSQPEALRAAGAERIGHIHFTDNDRMYPGHAQIDFYGILEALYDIGYEEQISFEYSPLPDPVTAAQRGLEYCRAILKQIEIRKAV